LNLARFLERHELALHRTALLLGLCPAVWLAWDCAMANLGTNPLDRLEKDTGRWAFNFLLITLAVTPLRRLATWVSTRIRAGYGRRLSDWNALIRLRRQLGLTCFFYACLHLGAYAWFDAGLAWSALRSDMAEKPYIVAGLAAFALLVPLAATSTRAAMRALGPHWKRLHRLVYAIGVLAACRFLWLSKPGLWPPYLYAAAVAALLCYHLLARLLLWLGT
jgi:sulfoxide reductase heme-binding subunit YedZ